MVACVEDMLSRDSTTFLSFFLLLLLVELKKVAAFGSHKQKKYK